LEAIMSSPIHHAKDLDPALMYAPPWARDQAQPAPSRDSAPPVEWPPPRRRFGAGPAFSGDRAVLEVKRQLALDPDVVPEPPVLVGDRTMGKIALRLCGAAGVAALAAWVIVSLPGVRFFTEEAVQAKSVATPVLNGMDKLDNLRAPVPAQLSVNEEHHDTSAPPPANKPVANPAVPQAVVAPETAAAAPAQNTLHLDDQEIAALVMRGKNFIANGDLASARLLLQRAAEAGNANAALALGATFDPLVIQRLGTVGGEPDAARARKWYQKAVELGSTAASQQLAKLVEARQ
jgi:hypothetical protein